MYAYYTMKILFISNDLIGGDVARLLKNEGHEVKLYIHEKDRRGNLDYMVEKVKNWKKELTWVGKDGLIVFDDTGYGKVQDQLRKKGYTVFGSSELGERLETDREFGHKIFIECGMKTVELKDFSNMEDAILYAQHNKKAWVIKQNGHASKGFNYVSHYDDSRDAISVLKNYLQNKAINQGTITLHERLVGVEIAVARCFNGTDWVGPIKLNVEHKKLFPQDLGPATGELGTLSWFDDDENNKLYVETLAKLKPFLQKVNFRGELDINCIVNESGAYPLEATARLGSPIVHLHSEIHASPWGELMYAVASGKSYNMKWKKGYGIVLLLAVPPFPYAKKMHDNFLYGVNVYFNDFTEEDFSHIHFEEVSLRPIDKEHIYYISDTRGYILYVTEMGKTVKEAQDKVYALAKRIIIPKMFYRHDIADKFVSESAKKLKEWGYLNHPW